MEDSYLNYIQVAIIIINFILFKYCKNLNNNLKNDYNDIADLFK